MDTPPDPNLTADERRVAALQSYDILDTPTEREFDDLCEFAAQLCGTPVAAVNFLDADRQWFKSQRGLGTREHALIHAVCQYTIREEKPLVVPDLLADARFGENAPRDAGNRLLRFYAGATIRSRDNVPLGTVCVLDYQPRELSDMQLHALQTLAGQVATILDLRRQAREARQLAATRGEVSIHLASAGSLREVLQHCTETVVDHLQGAFARIWTLDEPEATLVLQASAGMYTHLDGPHGRVKVGEFKIGRIARDRQPLLTNDVQHDPNIGDPEWARREHMVAFAGYPLLIEGRTVGVLAVFWQHAVSAMLLDDLAPIAQSVAQFIERKEAEAALARREQMARFLAQTSADLAQLLDHQSTLQKLASMSVPTFADWCTVDLVDESGKVRRLAVAHTDMEKVPTLRTMRREYPPRLSDPHGTGAVLRTGKPELVANVSGEMIEGMAQDAEHRRMLRELGPKSFLCVPIAWRGGILGALTYVQADSGRRYTALDLQMASDLARRAAVAMENAELYFELQDADRKKDEFLATLAHELRNPLAPLRNALTLFKATDCAPEVLRDTRDMMDRQLQQMVRLVDDLLDVSRITRNRIELRQEPVLLSAVAQSAVEISRELIDKAGHTLDVRLPDEPTWLFADATRLSQVFSNLLNNAAKYTENGGQISLSAEAAGGRVRVRVRDNGTGISAETLPHVFELFTQEGRSLDRAQGGLGIGLSLVQRLVEMHGGSVEARSAGRGEGSEFVVELPTMATPEKAAVEKAPAETARTAVASAAGTRRILVVDDNRDAAVTLTKLLRRRGHEVQTGFDGEEAVRMAREFDPDVVVLDIGLPKLNGYDAAQEIRRQSERQNLTLIALTGWGQEEDRRRAKEAGFTHHLTKPVVFEELVGLLGKSEEEAFTTETQRTQSSGEEKEGGGD